MGFIVTCIAVAGESAGLSCCEKHPHKMSQFVCNAAIPRKSRDSNRLMVCAFDLQWPYPFAAKATRSDASVRAQLP